MKRSALGAEGSGLGRREDGKPDRGGPVPTDLQPPGDDAALRLRHYTIFLILGVPLMTAFGVVHVLRGHYLLTVALFVSGVGLLAGRALVSASRNPLWVYRVNAALFGALLLYLCALGGEAGSKILWLYVFPLVTCFLLGAVEGVAWGGAILLGALGIFAGGVGLLHVHPYPWEFRTRFLITYLIVTIVAAWFERLRSEYRTGMQERQARLEVEKGRLEKEIELRENLEREKDRTLGELRAALADVKTLSGLIPICSSCKNIRDDKGYWHQVEVYVRQRSAAEFTHGICPDCMKRLYPDFHRKEG